MYNLEQARQILNKLCKDADFTIDIVGRGHQHNPYAIAELKEPMSEEAFAAAPALSPELDGGRIFAPVKPNG